MKSNDEEIQCDNCGSYDIFYNAGYGIYICNKCDNVMDRNLILHPELTE